MSEPLTKLESAVQGLSSPAKEKVHERASSSAAGVMDVKDLEKNGIELEIAIETQKTGWYAFSFQSRASQLSLIALWHVGHRTEHRHALAPLHARSTLKINKSSTTVDDPAILKLLLTKPPVKTIDLHFRLGHDVTARNIKGVTVKDALDAIHIFFKKRGDDELESPYLAGFEWDKEESWTQLIVHLQKQPSGGGKKKNKKEE
ncbi:hypothetical protein ACCO45_012297 [Purpureocillium lilacinum]|uniref:Uncharacterized protein n=1 Tax=Purpureocillium lilacinum TaxID=33203 RepID=A0ACC4D7V1_PURLI